MKIAFDIGGVLSKYPEKFRHFIHQLQRVPGIEVYVITDMHDVDKIYEMLVLNGFSIPKKNIYSADYATHGDGCKSELLRELGIDLFFDDHLAYLSIPDDTIRCLVMPDPYKPYWSPSWKTLSDTDSDFGRRCYKKKIATECEHKSIITHKQQGFHPRRGCLDCNTWLDPVELNGLPTC